MFSSAPAATSICASLCVCVISNSRNALIAISYSFARPTVAASVAPRREMILDSG